MNIAYGLPVLQGPVDHAWRSIRGTTSKNEQPEDLLTRVIHLQPRKGLDAIGEIAHDIYVFVI